MYQKIGITPKYKDLWDDRKEIEIYVDDKLIGIGNNKNKKTIAKNKVAAQAYENLDKQLAMENGAFVSELWFAFVSLDGSKRA